MADAMLGKGIKRNRDTDFFFSLIVHLTPLLMRRVVFPVPLVQK